MNKILIFLATIILFSQSCVVSKKKYDALNMQRAKSIDSLKRIENGLMKDYEKMKYTYTGDSKQKQQMIDSITLATIELAGDKSELKKSLQDAIAEYKKEKEKLTHYQKQLALNQSKLQNKNSTVDSLNNSLQEKDKLLQQLNAMINKNKAEVNKLKNIINDALNAFDKSELNVYLKDGKVYVAMEENLLFKSGSAKVDKRGENAVKKLGKVLEKNTDTEILIEGHTDNVGSVNLNWKLSANRALSIVNILQKHTKIDPKRITASGRGMYVPIAKNTTNKGKQKNRRIEIILVPKLNSLYEIMNNK